MFYPFASFGNNFNFSLQCVDAEGFCLFLKTYLEVEDFPADFCQRLFRYFQNVEQNGSSKSPQPKEGKDFLCSDFVVF